MKTLISKFNFIRRQLFAVLAIALAGALAMPAHAQMSYSTAVRTANMQDIITAIGTGGKAKWYNGTRPANLGAVTGGNTLLATLTWASNIGTASAGVLDIDEAGAAQTAASHVNGTPTFVDFTTSGDAVVVRIPICGSAPCITFTGTIATGQNITLTGLSITAGNP